MALPGYVTESDSSDAAVSSFMDRVLRVGEVVEAIPPNSPDNKDPSTKGRQWVYIVNVDYRDYDGSRQLVPYRCTVMDTFGGRADHIRHTVRPVDVPTEEYFGFGDQVLVLCPNGDKGVALIVGGMRHRDAQEADPSTTFYDFLFNGVHFSVDVDGQVKVEVLGATKPDGSPADTRDKNNKGSFVTFDKAGNIAVSDANGDTVTISPKDKSITVTAGTHTSTVKEAWKLKAATVLVEADEVTIDSGKVQLGGQVVNPLDEVVIGSGIDTFTGVPYKSLGSTSSRVKAKK
jgi:phage baseplate assembly protein gpV